MPDAAKDFRDVFIAEARELRKRRHQAELEELPLPDASAPSQAGQNPAAPKPGKAPFPRTGLAISGGGIRSASFGLGFLQSMYRHGVLRQFDYLSTVSGGSYVGSYLSSSIADQSEVNWEPGKPNKRREGRDVLPMLPDKNGKQPPEVLRLRSSGRALNQPLKFLNCQLVGMLLINLTAFCGLMAVAALLALAFRSLYSHSVWHILMEFGFTGDVWPAWAPSMALLLCWLFASWMSQGRSIPNPKVESRWSRIKLAVFMILVASVFMALASMLTIGDLSLPRMESGDAPAQTREKTTDWLTRLGQFALAAVVGAMLPYLRPKALIESGMNPKNRREKWVFAIASRAFLFGFPLVVFGLLCRENISGYNESRADRNLLAPMSISKWHDFWRRVEMETVSAAPAKTAKISQTLWDTATSDPELPHLYDVLRLSKSLYERDRNWSPLTHWNPLTFADRVQDRKDFIRWRQEITDAINDKHLSDPEFYTEIEATDLSGLDGGVQAEMNRRIQQARQLKSQAEAYQEDTDLFPKPANAKSDKLKGWIEATIERDRDTAGDPDSEPAQVMDANRRLAMLEPLLNEMRLNNWEMLRSYYGDFVRPPSTVFSYTVLDADQKWRMQAAALFGAAFLCLGFLVSLNGVSIHSFYREQLASHWIKPIDKFKTRIPLNKLDTVSKGGPYHIINATMIPIGAPDPKSDGPNQLFVLSPLYCGSHVTGFASTAKYDGECDLANAMAISGAAVTPLAAANPLVRALLLLANFRLGQWMPNPRRAMEGRWYPNPLNVLMGTFLRQSGHQTYCFVTDGGHRDNTGIESLLHRRCRVIVAVDASADGTSNFCDLLKLIGAQRVWFGRRIVGSSYHEHEFEELCLQCEQQAGQEANSKPGEAKACSETSDPLLPLSLLTPEQTDRISKSHFVVAEIRYPRDRYTDDAGFGPEPVATGYLIYVKPSFSDDEPRELVEYRKLEPDFPHDPTYDQFFDESRFECYRQLGEHIGDTLWSKLFMHAAQEAERQETEQWKNRISKRWRQQESNIVPSPEDIPVRRWDGKPWLSHWSPIKIPKEMPGCHEAVVQSGRPSAAVELADAPLAPFDSPEGAYGETASAPESNGHEKTEGHEKMNGHEKANGKEKTNGKEAPAGDAVEPSVQDVQTMLIPPPGVDGRMDDYLLKLLKHTKKPVLVVRVIGMLGAYVHSKVGSELARHLNKCNEKSDPALVLALIEVIGKIEQFPPEVVAALEKWVDAGSPAIRNAARAAIQRSKERTSN